MEDGLNGVLDAAATGSAGFQDLLVANATQTTHYTNVDSCFDCGDVTSHALEGTLSHAFVGFGDLGIDANGTGVLVLDGHAGYHRLERNQPIRSG